MQAVLSKMALCSLEGGQDESDRKDEYVAEEGGDRRARREDNCERGWSKSRREEQIWSRRCARWYPSQLASVALQNAVRVTASEQRAAVWKRERNGNVHCNVRLRPVLNHFRLPRSLTPILQRLQALGNIQNIETTASSSLPPSLPLARSVIKRNFVISLRRRATESSHQPKSSPNRVRRYARMTASARPPRIALKRSRRGARTECRERVTFSGPSANSLPRTSCTSQSSYSPSSHSLDPDAEALLLRNLAPS